MRLIQRFATGLCLSLFVWHAIADDTPAYITPVSVAELVEQGFDGERNSRHHYSSYLTPALTRSYDH